MILFRICITTNLNRFGATRQYGHAIEPRFLPLPERAVACITYSVERKLLVIDAELLEAHYVAALRCSTREDSIDDRVCC